VNEVTLSAPSVEGGVIAQALQEHARSGPASPARFPSTPWTRSASSSRGRAAQLADLREHRSLIRKSMSEIEERPELAPCVTAGWATCDALLHDYLVRLRALGFIAPGAEDDVLAGGAMLMGALFSDAMGRDMLPALFPQPEQSAPAVYVRLFLRAVACRGAAADAPAALAASGAHPEPPTSR
jgi:hypothetical protein